MPLREILVVPHTHWDREWYHTEEIFRQRLVRLIDELLDAPPERGASFLLDGQAILLDDYLLVRPERTAELSALLREGRLEAGPWYVLADNLIPGGEAIIRNLQHGLRTVRRLRGTAPKVLYCPDSFGHPAVLPDVAAGFGFPLIVLWRGLRGDSDLLRWTGQTGASALVYHLPPDGYEFGSSLPADAVNAGARWAAMQPVLEPRAQCGIALLLNGADHHARQLNPAAALDQLAQVAAPVRVSTVSLGDAASRLIEAAGSAASLPEIAGELRHSYGYTWTLQGTVGSRAHQKRANAGAERLFIRDVEPWIAQALVQGRTGRHRDVPTSVALLNTAWRTLLSAHPHDTLCGTSTDHVATAFDARVASAWRQAEALRDATIQSLIGHDAERARQSEAEWNPAVIVRNAVARSRGGVVELTLTQKISDVAVGPGSATRQGSSLPRTPWRVRGVPLQILEEGEDVELTESARAYPDADRIVRANAVGWHEEMPGYSISTHTTDARARLEIPHPVQCGERFLDNGLVRIEIGEDFSVSFVDHASSRSVSDLITFENNRDTGDLYTPSIGRAIRPLRARRCRLVHRGPIRGELVVEYQTYGSSRRNADHCVVILRLDADAKYVRITVEGQNRSSDHRLRLRITTGLKTARAIADAAFFPVVRESIASAASAEQEAVIPTAPLHRWVAHSREEATTLVTSDGLAEYESLSSGHIAITLVRAVGELSKVALPERPGHAGWPVATPAAQSIGAFGGSFAVALFGESFERVQLEIERMADDVLIPLRGTTLRSNLQPAGTAGKIELHGDGLVFSCAVPAVKDGWITLRCVNRHDREIAGEWRMAAEPVEAVRVRMDEEPLERGCDVDAGVISFTAAPKEIVTILVR